MEPEGVASESSWSSFDSAMATEESELLAQFLGNHNLSNEQEQEPSMLMQSLFWSDQGIDPNYGSQYINTNMCYWPMENSCNFSAFSCSNKQTTNYESFCNNMESSMMPTTGMRSEPMLLCMEEENISIASIKTNQKNHLDGKISMNDGEDIGEIKKSQGKRKIEACEGRADSMMIESSSKKKVGKSGGKSSKSKKADKTVEVGEEEEVGNASAAIVKTSSCYSSEDEADTSQELNGGDGTSTSTSPKGSTASLNSNGKMKAGRGSATDPQSLYARRRRERINERLKILQKLVPNGTKVDISTMLEEAVQYVKFLQVQIKLLSSDELWMYAPIAYNGLNIGVDLKMSPS